MENNFVNVCILQFPYGREGSDELRKKPDGSFITLSIDVGKYIEHLSCISVKYFQYKLFILQLYNTIMKQWMLRYASFRICNKMVRPAAMHSQLVSFPLFHAWPDPVTKIHSSLASIWI